MLQNSEYAVKFFDLDSTIIHFHILHLTPWRHNRWFKLSRYHRTPSVSPGELEGNLRGTPQSLLLCFMRKMFQWQPENRASAKELLADAWLKSSQFNVGFG